MPYGSVKRHYFDTTGYWTSILFFKKCTLEPVCLLAGQYCSYSVLIQTQVIWVGGPFCSG